MTESEFRDLLKQNISGGFLFWGDEDYLKNHYRKELSKAVLAECPPDLYDFNHIRLTLEDGDFSALTTALSSLPMFSEKKVVEVSPPDMSSWRESDRKSFLDAIEGIGDSPDTVLLLIAPRGTLDPGTPKKPAPFFRALTKILTPVEFPYQTGVRLRRWVERHFAGANLTLTDEAMSTLLARCPQDMTGLSGEIEKLIAYCLAKEINTVTPEIVTHVTAPALREDAFALANAVLAGDRTAALSALDVCRKQKEEPIVVLASLARVMSDLLTVSVMVDGGADKAEIARSLKMHEYKASLYIKSAKGFGTPRLAASLKRCRDADRMMKSSYGGGYLPLERLICTMPQGGKSAPKGGRYV